jgi:hypothetical protein
MIVINCVLDKETQPVSETYWGANWSFCIPLESAKGTRRLMCAVPSRVEGSPAPPHVTAAAHDNKFTSSAAPPAAMEASAAPPPVAADRARESPRLRSDASEVLSRKVPSSKSTAAAPSLRCLEVPRPV